MKINKKADRHRLSKIFTTGIFILIFLAFAFQVQGATYHVNSVNEANNVSGLQPGDIVLIKGGTYSQTLRPARSGSASGYITYGSYNGQVTIKGSNTGIDLGGRSYIVIDEIDIENTNGAWISLGSGAHHITIQNGHFEGSNGWSGIDMNSAHHIRILNNYMKAHCPCSSICNQGGPSDILYIINSKNILIEGNKIYDGLHDNVDIQDRIDNSPENIIIRDNYLSNKYHGALDLIGVEQILVENNVIVDCGEEYGTNWCGSQKDRTLPRNKQRGLKISGSLSILRNNVFTNDGYGIYLLSGRYIREWEGLCNNNRVYNNTMHANYRGFYLNAPDPAVDNIIKNNIVSNNIDYTLSNYNNSANTYINNNLIGPVIQYGTNDQNINNISANPMYVNAGARNFHLASNSTMINAGMWLTFTRSAGSGTQIPVEDARYFMNGWGLIDGDLIQFQGQTQTYRVTNVNYSTNTITISQSASWTNRLGLSLTYKGSKPDMGAFEYGGTTTPPTLEIATTSLPPATTNMAYSQTIAATGGTTPYIWTVINGRLPNGLSLSSNGTISGTPTATGTSNFTAKVTDNAGATDNQALTLIVDGINLANGSTHTGDSDNFYDSSTENFGPENLWDGDVSGTSAGNSGIHSFWVEYDLGQLYDISMIRFYGDADGDWVSREYSVLVKQNSGDSYTAFIDHANCFTNGPIETTPSSLTIRYIRLEVYNEQNPYSAQAYEFEVFGTHGSVPTPPVPPTGLSVTKDTTP